jgi:hypothetical protein
LEVEVVVAVAVAVGVANGLVAVVAEAAVAFFQPRFQQPKAFPTQFKLEALLLTPSGM